MSRVKAIWRRLGQPWRRFTFMHHEDPNSTTPTSMSRKQRSRLLETESPHHSSRGHNHQVIDIEDYRKPVRPNRKPLVPKTDNQARYLDSMRTSTITIGSGPAGVGKTYMLGSYAAELLESGEIEQVIVTRPAVEAGESLGFLPGELDEKFGPFLKPFRDVMVERLGANDYKGKVKSDRISPQPLSHMRGSTFKNALMILDEAQNCTVEQVKMFLTRIGEGSRIVMDGDPEQCDLHEPSGLVDALRRFRDTPGFQIIEFTEDDCVRHDIIKHILKGYRRKL